MEKLLCPSLLNLSMDYLKDEIMRLDVSGADILHIDVMDQFTLSIVSNNTL